MDADLVVRLFRGLISESIVSYKVKIRTASYKVKIRTNDLFSFFKSAFVCNKEIAQKLCIPTHGYKFALIGLG